MSGPLPIPVLTGDVVTLRAHRSSDTDPVHERAVDPLARQYTTVPLEYTRELAAEYVAEMSVPSPDRVSWAIELDGRYAGSIDLRVMSLAAGAGSLGFATHPALRGRGVMSQAVSLVCGHAFGTLGWQSVRWEAHAGNWGSAKVVWRAGFPVPTFVPALLIERDRVIDGWISTLFAQAPREPVATWDEVHAALSASLPTCT